MFGPGNSKYKEKQKNQIFKNVNMQKIPFQTASLRENDYSTKKSLSISIVNLRASKTSFNNYKM